MAVAGEVTSPEKAQLLRSHKGYVIVKPRCRASALQGLGERSGKAVRQAFRFSSRRRLPQKKDSGYAEGLERRPPAPEANAWQETSTGKTA
jgi:hypothetical protein